MCLEDGGGDPGIGPTVSDYVLTVIFQNSLPYYTIEEEPEGAPA